MSVQIKDMRCISCGCSAQMKERLSRTGQIFLSRMKGFADDCGQGNYIYPLGLHPDFKVVDKRMNKDMQKLELCARCIERAGF